MPIIRALQLGGEELKVDFGKLDRAFNPKCVVVVGDKAESGYSWLNGQSTVKGKVYSVQVSPAEIEGIKALGVENYTSILDIPEAIDLAIIAVPRAVALRVMEDCIRKDAAAAHFFTAGFAETDTDEGREFERRMKERAEETNFHIVGPNCMGIFSPRAGVRQNRDQYTDVVGPVGFIAQSGTHAVNFARNAHLQGVDINKSVSFGNGTVVDCTDYLEYFGQDPEIKAIGMYIEGVRDGRRFINVLREVTARKPVVIWKGGRTEEGNRAIASHTASLAVPQAVWDAVMRQCGAIKVGRSEEMIDTLKALLYLPPIEGNRVAVTGGSGGQSVAIADAIAEAGLKLPLLTRDSYDELASFFSLIGGGYLNPVDTGNTNRREMKRILEILAKDSNIDNLVLLAAVGFGRIEMLERDIEVLVSLKETTAKPMMSFIYHAFSPEHVEVATMVMQKCQSAGLPAFIGLERGAVALRNALTYYEYRRRLETSEALV